MTQGLRSSRLVLLAGLVLATTGSAVALEGEDGAQPAPGSAIHAELGFDITNKYFFRGLLQEDNGFIGQPWFDISVDLVERDGWTLSANVGTWSSFHGESDTAGTTDSLMKHWYEADLYAGLEFGVSGWSFGASYNAYTSPSDAFSTVSEIDLTVSYDDGSLWGESDFALNPHLTVAIETHDRGGSEDSYLELGVEPSWDVYVSDTKLSLAVPLTVGLGLDDYYVKSNGDDEAFGFFDAGVTLGVPLPIPDRFGAWTLSGGVHLLFLGDAAREVNDDDEFEVIGVIGVSLSF
jgi:hypothetical protein